MPIMKCQKKKKKGFKFGDEGFCYTDSKARTKARKQGVAIKMSQIRKSTFDPFEDIIKGRKTQQLQSTRTAVKKHPRRTKHGKTTVHKHNRKVKKRITIINGKQRRLLNRYTKLKNQRELAWVKDYKKKNGKNR